MTDEPRPVDVQWVRARGGVYAHAVPTNQRTPLCGATPRVWWPDTPAYRHCPTCVSKLRRLQASAT